MNVLKDDREVNESLIRQTVHLLIVSCATSTKGGYTQNSTSLDRTAGELLQADFLLATRTCSSFLRGIQILRRLYEDCFYPKRGTSGEVLITRAKNRGSWLHFASSVPEKGFKHYVVNTS